MIIGIGVDIVEISRIELALERTPRFREEMFTANERAYAALKARPAFSYALMFAAKEAVFKALHIADGRPHWQAIELLHTAGGIPRIQLHGTMLKRAEELGIDEWHISCSHSDMQAISYCIAEKKGGVQR